MHEKNYTGPLILLTSLFFIWGFLTSMNDILIPYLKSVFELSYFRVMLVQFAFFGAYFIGSLIYFSISMKYGDPIVKIGYQNSAVLGLLVAGLGAALFYPASQFISYGLFLAALFILALGFTLLQISANPYVTLLGREQTAASRLNLAQGFNSLGTTLGPLLGGFLIFEYFHSTSATGAAAVKAPYLIFAGLLFLAAIALRIAKLPRIISSDTASGERINALQFPHLVLGILAIFMYVGAEVSIGSMLINFFKLENIAALPENQGSAYVAVYWGGLMIGRFMGAISLSNLSPRSKHLSLLYIPFLGFLFLALSLSIGRQSDYLTTLHLLLPYLGLLGLNLLAFFMGRFRAGRTTAIFALFAIGLILTTIFSNGYVALWCIVGVGLFNSIMWSNIFSLAINGLGAYKSQASSLLVMAIVGGALFPLAQGLLADHFGVQASFALPLIAYAYISFYGWKGHLARTHQQQAVCEPVIV